MQIFNGEDGQMIAGFSEDWLTITQANRILKERLEVGYTTKYSTNSLADWAAITSEIGGADTHKIYYFTEPLKAEKVECDHIRIQYLNASGNPAVEIKYETKFCPKCGEKLQ